MSGIAGYFSTDNSFIDQQKLVQASKSILHRGPDDNNIWQREGVGMSNCLLHTTPESLQEQLPLHDHKQQLVLAADARIDNREELINQLRIEQSTSHDITDSQIILAAYSKWKEDCAEKLLGDFAFAIWDAKTRTLFCARDHIGVKPFYYYWDGRLFVFASEIKAIRPFLVTPLQANQQRILDLLVFFYSDNKSTFYNNIYRLQRASHLVVRESSLNETCYFQFNPEKKLIFSSENEAAEAFRELFLNAVNCRLRSAFPIGTTLSGGLDSSSITCVARNYLQKQNIDLHTFSAIFPNLPPNEFQKVDERKYMDAVINQGGLHAHFIEADKLSPIDFLVRHNHEEPIPCFNGYIHEGIYKKACEHGVRVLLDGIDGDTTVYHGYSRLYDLGRSFNILALIEEAKAFAAHRGQKYTNSKILKEYIFKPLLPATLKKIISHLKGIEKAPPYDNFILSTRVANEANWEERSSILSIQPSPRSHSQFKHYADLQHPILQYTMEMMDTVSGKLPLECRYPFWDRPLMELCLAIPTEYKFQSGISRVVFRNAMDGILPEHIHTRVGKADLSPHFDICFNTQAEEKFINEVLHTDILFSFVDKTQLQRIVTKCFGHEQATNNRTLLYSILALNYWINNCKEFSL